MQTKSFLTLIILFLSLNSMAWCPQLSVEDIPTFVNLNNDISPRTTLKLNRGDNYSGCDILIGVSTGTSPNYNRKLYSGIDQIDFNIAKNNSMNQILTLWNPGGSSTLIEEKFNSNSNKQYINFRLYAEATLSGNEPPGIYTDTFEIVLYQSFFGFYFYHSSWPITYQYEVHSNINLSIVDSNQPFNEFDTSQDLNFGTIIQGDQKSFDVVIQSTSGYKLFVRSQHNGKVKHTNNSVNSEIDYTFRSNGVPINLSNSSNTDVQISSGIGTHPGDGFRIPIQVEMGDPSSKLAGTYEDYLTVTVETNL